MRVGGIGQRGNWGERKFDHGRVGEIGDRVNDGEKELQGRTEWCC